MKKLILLFVIILSMFMYIDAQEISRSFELRYFTVDPKANGETDFRGETEFFNTRQRIEYLKHYAEVAKKEFKDPYLDTRVVSEKQLQAALQQLKPQPLPGIRTRIRLDQWKWIGYKKGQVGTEKSDLDVWLTQQGVETENGILRFTRHSSLKIPLDRQSWRFYLEWEVHGGKQAGFTLQGQDKAVARVGIEDGLIKTYSAGKTHTYELDKQSDSFLIKIEVDLENGRYNTFLNEELIADFVPLINNLAVDKLVIVADKGLLIDNVFGMGFQKAVFTEDQHTRDIPYSINILTDQDFELKPSLQDWQKLEYDDNKWKTASLPYPHGGKRYAGEDLYMRTKINPGEFERAELVFETMVPGGEIWVNNQIVVLKNDRHPGSVNISEYLVPRQENILAIKVYPSVVKHRHRHVPDDVNTGWFAGRMHIDLTSKRYISDLFTYTKSLQPGTMQQVRISLKNEDWEEEENEMKKVREFNGRLRIEFYPWYPDESERPVAAKVLPVKLRLMKDVEIETDIEIPNAELWSVERPYLYEVVATLQDDRGKAIDNFVTTTGIRTISQKGGTFRINGEPSVLNGALLSGSYRSPLEKIAQWIRAAPDEWLIKELLMIRNMNGNMLRICINPGMDGGINDLRIAEFADQLGVMFIWQTGTWVRTASPWLLDFEGLPKYVKQARNHPSIVMWQPMNHPKSNDFEGETIPFYKKVYDAIYPNDPSRLISPAASNTTILGRNDLGTLDHKRKPVEPFPIWTAPMITRGDMDHATGYGARWSTLRKYPVPPEWTGEQGWRTKSFRHDYLNSKERAYFDFESEESVGQPNWNLRKGKPSYKIKSYELLYDQGSIGRQLSLDEWEESQAWQAFSGFEAYKKKRWLDYDGFAWCTLHGGQNSATYQKALIDYYGHAKLAFHALKMAYQKTLAGSDNVDIVYGPEDKIRPVIMHLGKEMSVDLTVDIRDLNGESLATKTYRNVVLQGGRSVTRLASFHPELDEGYFVIHYSLRSEEKSR